MDNLLCLQELFNRKIFRIPDYQRGYSWRTQQLEEFWDDLLSLLPNQDHYTGMLSLKEVTADEIENNKDKWTNEQWLLKSGYKVNEIVDGQQRLTTIIILIHEIINYCNHSNPKVTKLNDVDSIPEIESQYLYRQKDGGIIRTYIFGYKADNPSDEYFRINILEDPNKSSTNETFYTLNLNNAKEFFRNKLEKMSVSEVEDIYKKVTVNLKFNLYNIKDNFNVFVAFETMNNRGKRLSYLELLKNRLIYLSTLFKNEEDEKEIIRDGIKEAWKEVYGFLGKNKNHPLNDDEFLQHHWIIFFGFQTRRQGGRNIPFNEYLLNKYFLQQNINKNNLGFTNSTINDAPVEDDTTIAQEDEEYSLDEEIDASENDEKSLSLMDIKKYVDSLRALIPFWYTTYEPSFSDNSDIAKYLFRLNTLGYINARPLITVVLSKDDIDAEKKIECIRLVERFNFLYYRLDNYSSTYNSTVFYNLARDLYYDSITIDDVLATLKTNDAYYLSSNNVILSNGPIDKFSKLMNRDGFYSWSSLKYLLFIYDLNISGSTVARQKLDPDEYFKQDPKDKCSIEHIYPQTPTDPYWVARFGEYDDRERKCLVGSLGNMLPLSLRINKRLQNDSFDLKKNGTSERERGYINGSSSEMQVANSEEWTAESILARGMGILKFMEDEFDFKFPNDLYRKKLLGLEFMANEADADSNKTEPLFDEPEKKAEKIFDESTFKKLSSAANADSIAAYSKIHEYCVGLSESAFAYTTPNYISYADRISFMDFYFYRDRLHLLLCNADYDDPQKKLKKLGDNYNWAKKTVLDIYPGDDLEYAKHLIKQSYDYSMRANI